MNSFLTKQFSILLFLNTDFEKINIAKEENGFRIAPSHYRLIAAMFDFSICFLILRFLIFPIYLFFSPSEESVGVDPISVLMYSGALLLFFCKDFLKGGSLGKRFFNLRVSYVQDSFPTPGFRILFLRNCFLILLPLELLLLILNKHYRRWGDKFFGTFVIQEIKPFQVRSLTIRFISILLIFSIFWVSYQLLTPVLIKNTPAYRFAENYVSEDRDIREMLGDHFKIGFWLDTLSNPPLKTFNFKLYNSEKEIRYSLTILEQDGKYSFYERKIQHESP